MYEIKDIEADDVMGVTSWSQDDVISRTFHINPLLNSSFNQLISTEPDDTWLQDTLSKIRMAFLPIILVGTVTNCLNFLLLTHREMRSSSTTVFLFSLTLADLGVMYLELFRIWFEWTKIIDPSLYFSDGYCKIANYTNDVARDYSNWLIVCLTFERLVKVACPYRAKIICTPRSARRVSLGLLLAVSLSRVYTIVYSTAQFNIWWVCWADPKASSLSLAVAAAADFIVGYMVVIVVFILNVALACIIYRKNRPPRMTVRGGLCSQSSSAATVASLALPICAHKWRAQSRRMTRTLLAVAAVFIVCETPRMLFYFLFKFEEKTPTFRIILNVSFALSGINHAANFFIYILSSPRFRHLVLDRVRGLTSKIPLPCLRVRQRVRAAQNLEARWRRDRGLVMTHIAPTAVTSSGGLDDYDDIDDRDINDRRYSSRGSRWSRGSRGSIESGGSGKQSDGRAVRLILFIPEPD